MQEIFVSWKTPSVYIKIYNKYVNVYDWCSNDILQMYIIYKYYYKVIDISTK